MEATASSDILVIQMIVDKKGDFYSQCFRDEFIEILQKRLLGGEYDPTLNALIYSYWKMHSSERCMKGEIGVPVCSCENAWDILRKVNLGEVLLPDDLQRCVKYGAF